MATLAAITVAQFMAYATPSGDTSGEFGRWRFDGLTAMIAALPTPLNPFTVKFDEAVTLLAGLELDYQNLTDTEYAQAWEAMANAVAYALLARDSSGFTLPAERVNDMRKDYGDRLYFYWNRAGIHWRALGVADADNPYFNSAAYAPQLSTVTPLDGRNVYPYNYYLNG